ncbi:MAG: type IV pilus assembly protein PilM [Phycisphaerales bacterium]|nr:MAG: type IV pilus assembly protein PilM [Phycisphaerales bacterium]
MNWKRILNFGKDQALGLDIGSSWVKIIRLRREGTGYAVTAAGIAEILQSKEEGQDDRMETIRAIRKCVESCGVRTKLAVCGVCGPEVAVREFEFPSLPAEEIEGAVLLEASQVCPFNVEEGIVDYQLTAEEQGKTRGVLVAATNSLVRNTVQIAKDACLNSILMDVDGLALLNCLSECVQPEEVRTTAVLNVGASHTTLAVMGDDGRPFIRDMTYAGNHIIDRIATEKAMAPETVRGLLFGDSGQNAPEFGASLERGSEQLIGGVATTSRYYKTQAKSAAFDKLLVCGGFALANGFVGMLNRRLAVEAVLWNPFETIRHDMDDAQEAILEKNGPALVVAAGLAMRSV